MTNVWDDTLLKNPHAVSDKRRRVQSMFAAIAPSYDLNNRLHSLWMDQAWRRKAVKLADLKPTDRVVDVACGTGDLTLAFFKGLHHAEAADSQVMGIDFTYEMLPIAVAKWGKNAPGKQTSPIRFINGDAQSLSSSRMHAAMWFRLLLESAMWPTRLRLFENFFASFVRGQAFDSGIFATG